MFFFHKIKKSDFVANFLVFIIVVIVGFFNATRDSSVGADNLNYINYYERGEYFSNRFEPLFALMAFLIGKMEVGYEYFFFSCYFVITSDW